MIELTERFDDYIELCDIVGMVANRSYDGVSEASFVKSDAKEKDGTVGIDFKGTYATRIDDKIFAFLSEAVSRADSISFASVDDDDSPALRMMFTIRDIRAEFDGDDIDGE